ncbi:MAG TPA: universal stress protein [Candidatus Omnitrophota bacterium]|nr:universal stress protein [Candidatus Omnitrophota bacterium]
MIPAYKTMLVPVPDGRSAASPLDVAFRLAAEFQAHVIGLHVRVDPTAAVPLMGEGMSGAMVEDMMTAAERQGADRADQAKMAFDAACDRHGVIRALHPPAEGLSAEWVDIVGREEEAVAWRGRLNDLVAMARPDPGADTPSLMTLNAALMESGKPLLLTPPVPKETIGTRIAIAWNGSAEAGRAVVCAMPLLKRAAHVLILSIAEDERTNNAPAGELAAYLAWHGVRAECKVTSGAAANPGEALLKECEYQGIDLLVMGAYTHSRLRQLILGGVTRHVIHHADIPVLMCH